MSVSLYEISVNIYNIQGHNSHMYDTPRYNQLKIIGIQNTRYKFKKINQRLMSSPH